MIRLIIQVSKRRGSATELTFTPAYFADPVELLLTLVRTEWNTSPWYFSECPAENLLRIELHSTDRVRNATVLT